MPIIKLLQAHGIDCTIQDGKAMAVDVYTTDGAPRAEWVCLDGLNVWHWLGY